MDTKTIAVLRDLNATAITNQLDVDQWATMLKQQLQPEQFALVADTISSGTLYIRNKEYRDMASGVYPWMVNDTIIDDSGKKITITPWMEKIQSQGVTRPKDVIHLDRIVRLVDNPAAKELFGF